MKLNLEKGKLYKVVFRSPFKGTPDILSFKIKGSARRGCMNESTWLGRGAVFLYLGSRKKIQKHANCPDANQGYREYYLLHKERTLIHTEWDNDPFPPMKLFELVETE